MYRNFNAYQTSEDPIDKMFGEKKKTPHIQRKHIWGKSKRKTSMPMKKMKTSSFLLKYDLRDLSINCKNVDGLKPRYSMKFYKLFFSSKAKLEDFFFFYLKRHTYVWFTLTHREFVCFKFFD